jgi:hypothetical protein
MSTLRLPEAFATAFDRSAALVAHTLDDHALLTPDAVAELADRLPAGAVEHNRGSLPAVVADGVVETIDGTPGQVARGIETNGCWMVLKNVEQDAAYAALLDTLLDQVATGLDPRHGAMRHRKGFIFLSAPGSVTPSHFDPEHNVLLQVRGCKDVTIGSFPDATTEREELERSYAAATGTWAGCPPTSGCTACGPDRACTCRSTPRTGSGTATPSRFSLSITFQTAVSRRAQQVHMANARLRRLGLTPQPPGRRVLVDRAKAAVAETYGRSRRSL